MPRCIAPQCDRKAGFRMHCMLQSCAAKLPFCQKCCETMEHCPWCGNALRGELSDLTTSSGDATQHEIERMYDERMSLWSQSIPPATVPRTCLAVVPHDANAPATGSTLIGSAPRDWDWRRHSGWSWGRSSEWDWRQHSDWDWRCRSNWDWQRSSRAEDMIAGRYSRAEWQAWALSSSRPSMYVMNPRRQDGGENLSYWDVMRDCYGERLISRGSGPERADAIPLLDADPAFREARDASALRNSRNSGGSTPMTSTPRSGTFSATVSVQTSTFSATISPRVVGTQHVQICERCSAHSVDDAVGVALAEFDGSEYAAADDTHASYLSFERGEPLRRLLTPANLDPGGWAYGQVYHVDGSQRTTVEGWFPQEYFGRDTE